VGEHCCIVATVNLYSLITVVGGDNPVLGEDHGELFLLVEKPGHVLVQAGNVNQLQFGGIFLSQLTVFHIKHHESYVLVIIVKLLGLVAKLGLHLDDAVEGLVGDHGLEPDIQLQEGSRVTAVQGHLMQTSPGAWLAHVLK